MSAFALLCAADAPAQGLQEKRPWKIRITSENEPGIPMIVTGRVVDRQGRPVPHVKVYVFHADATGRYNPQQDESRPRLHGTLWTNEEGRFEFRTIRPAPYPGTRRGEHFHIELSEGGIAPHKATISFWEDRKEKLTLDITGSRRLTGFAWKPDPNTGGQRLQIDLPVRRRASSGER